MIYFAYGSNLNIAQMWRRCPGATPLGKFHLLDAKLMFRGVADCVYAEGEKCPGGLWKITPDDLRALDRYEGRNPDNSGMYRREWVSIEGIPGETRVLYYAMNSEGIWPPSEDYLRTIKQGYRDFDLPLGPLRAAVKASWDNRAPSHVERKRYSRNGRPRLGTSRTLNDWNQDNDDDCIKNH